jgi:hypothetical protein
VRGTALGGEAAREITHRVFQRRAIALAGLGAEIGHHHPLDALAWRATNEG